MGVATHDGCSCCGEARCECVPAEFVRLRYYYGQRLGVMELTDAQAYVVGKQRFHNLHCHGTGVLCGLAADRFVFPQGGPANQPSTVLRVQRGAALDACGREVIVPDDQCLDVAAWFARRRTRADLATWKAGETHQLWVTVQYRECPSDPAPGPRDPCGCGAGGCEFGRVREGFELALLTDDGAKDACTGGFVPSPADLCTALGDLALDEPLTGTTLDRLAIALDRLTGGACPPPKGDAWVCLATLQATLAADAGGTPQVTAISDPDNTIPQRRALLSVGALQAMIEALATSAADEGTVGPGPRLGPLTFVPGADATSGQFLIAVALITEGQPPAVSPLAQDTFNASMVRVSRFTGTGWADATPAAANLTYDPGASRLTIRFDAGGLAANTRYRISLSQPPEAPVVDAKMRPLHPSRFARHVRLVADGAVLKVADSLF